MVSICANPECSEEFRFLHEGVLYSTLLGAKPEFYWLCASCAKTLTIAIDKQSATVMVVARSMSASSVAVQSIDKSRANAA